MILYMISTFLYCLCLIKTGRSEYANVCTKP
jgi:hypothetical protein